MEKPAWYVLHSKPRKEAQVASYLEFQGIEVFYPSAKVNPVNPRAAKTRSYFPGYLFAHVSLFEVGTSALKWVPGTTGMVHFGGEPAIVPDHFILELQRHILEIAASGGLKLLHLKHGDTVLIESGPFVGHEAIFDFMLDDRERAQVMIQWLGQQLKMRVNANALAKKRVG